MAPWRKAALAVAVALGLLGLGYCVHLAFASDETRIRRRLGAMIADFNDGELGAVAGGLAGDFRDLTTGLDREQLLGVLRYAIFHERDPRTRKFALRVELDEERLEIQVDGEAARLVLPIRIHRLTGGEVTATRAGEVKAELRCGDDGWQLTRARHTWQPGGRGLRWRW